MGKNARGGGVMNILQILAHDKEVVTYRKELKKITNSVTATILLQQIIYWSEKMHGEFYKFIEPPSDKDNNKLYQDGDSWTEELAFSKREFQTAYKKLENLELVEKSINRQRVTYYKLNKEKIIKKLNEVYKQKDECVAKHENVRSVSTGKSVSTHENVRRYTSETTTKNTSETTTTESCSNFFEIFLKEKSKNAKNKQAYQAVIRKKFDSNEESVVNEFNYYIKNLNKNKIEKKLIYFREKKIILDDREYKIFGIDMQEDKLHVYLDNMYKNSHQVIFQDIKEIEKRLVL